MFATLWHGTDALAPSDKPGWTDVKDTLTLSDYGKTLAWHNQATSVQIPRGDRAPTLSTAYVDELMALVKAHTEGRHQNHITILVHGFLFDPSEQEPDPSDPDDPRTGVFAVPGKERQPGESWLPIFNVRDATAAADAPLLCFCWTSRGAWARASWSNPYLYPLFDLAPQAARALAGVIQALHANGITIDILAHSLGTRVALKAMGYLDGKTKASAVRRMVLLNGAEYSIDARDAIEGAATHVFNLVNSNDAVLSTFAEQAAVPFRAQTMRESWVIGYRGVRPTETWIDIAMVPTQTAQQKKQKAVFKALGQFTIESGPDSQRGPHWINYRAPENQRFIRMLLSDPGMSPSFLRSLGIVEGFNASAGAAAYGDIAGIPVPQPPLTSAQRKQQTWP
ncbi:MAG: hypothetical protein SF002_07635 [Alphaproteobacteria bacterium]|nr:hypothetical protein [Alphaproteobacteria bacterium]